MWIKLNEDRLKVKDKLRIRPFYKEIAGFKRVDGGV
jgi:hypothetical protein